MSHSTDELDRFVSQWTNEQVEENLNIYYDAIYLPSPLSVLQKLTDLDSTKLEIDEEQKMYIEKIETYLKFDTVIDELFEGYNLERLRNTASEMLKKAMKEPDGFVRSKLKSFIRSFERLLKDLQESNMSKEKKKLYEGNFTQLVGDFAELCCLKPIYSIGPVVWKGFRGMPEVISTPDIRLFHEGTPDQYPSDMSIPLVEVKTYSELQCIRCRRKECACNYYKTKLRRKRKDHPKNHCSTSSSEAELSDKMELRINPHISSSTSSISSDTSIDISNTPKKVVPEIASRFSKKVLGRHAGVLLFDVHKYCRNVEGCIHRVPGLIIDGTKVIFTMLEISNKHYQKIEKNETLDKYDKASIYYSGSFDILNENKRNVVLENFMRLNNLKKCSCHFQLEETTQKNNAGGVYMPQQAQPNMGMYGGPMQGMPQQPAMMNNQYNPQNMPVQQNPNMYCMMGQQNMQPQMGMYNQQQPQMAMQYNQNPLMYGMMGQQNMQPQMGMYNQQQPQMDMQYNQNPNMYCMMGQQNMQPQMGMYNQHQPQMDMQYNQMQQQMGNMTLNTNNMVGQPNWMGNWGVPGNSGHTLSTNLLQ